MNNIKNALQKIANYGGSEKAWRKALHKHTADPMPKSDNSKELEKELDERIKPKSVPMPKAEMPHKKAAKDKIPGGLADGMDDDEFNQKQLDMGEQIEYEHTDDKDTAREIAKDHLVELSNTYYSRLKQMEEAAKEAGELNEDAEEKVEEKRKNASFIVLCHRCEDDLKYCNCENTCPNCEEKKDECTCACKSCGKMPDLCSCEEEEDIQDIIDPDACDSCGNLIEDCECDRCDNCSELLNSCLCNNS